MTAIEELAEVTAALCRHPAVREAVTMADEGAGARSLRAYVCLDSRVVPGADAMVRLAELPCQSRPLVIEVSEGLPICVASEPDARLRFGEIFAADSVTAMMTFPAHGCVLDVGANIGLFTLFAAARAPGARIFAVEPAPELFELLRQNVNLHGIDAVLLPYDLGDESAGSARTISAIFIEERIDRVTLLRIDADGSETQVLAGIHDEHWPLIDQVCLRLGDDGDRLALASNLLAERGFDVGPPRPCARERPGRPYLHAARPGLAGASQPVPVATAASLPRLPSLRAVIEEIRDEVASVLPPSLVPAIVTPVTSLPRVPGAGGPVSETGSTVCSLVARILGVPSVGLADDVFGLGCSSLGAVKLTAAICKQFSVPFKLRMVLDKPTAAGITAQVEELLRNRG